jgi:hypothetical protein
MAFTKNQPEEKIIYKQDELYATIGKKGPYMSFSTLNPANSFKSVYVAPLSEIPTDPKIILTTMTNEKGVIKIILNKNKLEKKLKTDYKTIVSNLDSPWLPKSLVYDDSADGDDESSLSNSIDLPNNKSDLNQITKKQKLNPPTKEEQNSIVKSEPETLLYLKRINEKLHKISIQLTAFHNTFTSKKTFYQEESSDIVRSDTETCAVGSGSDTDIDAESEVVSQ